MSKKSPQKITRIRVHKYFLTILPLDFWDILVAEQPSFKELHIAIWSGSCPDPKGEDYDHGILCATG
jgi:hypothetical protein